MYPAKIALTFISALLLSSCVTGTQAPAPVSTYGSSPGLGSGGVHVVQGNDTLYDISKRYRIAMRDIAYLNKLDAPFVLKPGQRLKLPPPQEYKVRSGDTLYEISRLFNTDTSSVARQNNLSAPYKIRPGQVLRMTASVPAPRTKPQPRGGSQPFLRSKPEREKQNILVAGKNNTSSPSLEQQNVAMGNVLRVPERERPYKTSGQVRESASAVRLENNARPIAAPNPKIASTPPARASSKFLQPVRGRVVSSYGPKKDGLHNDGINIAAARGTPVQAAENGVVVYVGNELKGSGNLILVRHSDGYMSAYAHLNEFKVNRGDTVRRGQDIGTVGSTGAVSEPQLHFEIRRGTKAIDPQGYLGS